VSKAIGIDDCLAGLPSAEMGILDKQAANLPTFFVFSALFSSSTTFYFFGPLNHSQLPLFFFFLLLFEFCNGLTMESSTALSSAPVSGTRFSIQLCFPNSVQPR
jgi:hypothetical protein